MRWAAVLTMSVGLALAAGAASACPTPRGCPLGHPYDHPGAHPGFAPYEHAQRPEGARPYPPEYDDAPHATPRYADESVWRDERGGMYMHGYRAAPCRCPPGRPARDERSEIRLSDRFFADAGGVGPIPSDVYQGGGYVIVGSHAQARAYAYASASARTSVSVRYRGGFKGGKRR